MPSESLMQISCIAGATVLCLAVLFGLAYRYCQNPLLLGTGGKRMATSRDTLAPLMWEFWEWFNPEPQRQLASKLAMVQTQGVMLKRLWFACGVILAIASIFLAISVGSFKILSSALAFFTLCIIFEVVMLALKNRDLPLAQQWRRYRQNLKQQYEQQQARAEQLRNELQFSQDNFQPGLEQANINPGVSAEEAQQMNAQPQGVTAFTPTLIGILFLFAVLFCFWLGPLALPIFTPLLGATACLIWMVKYVPRKQLHCRQCDAALAAVTPEEVQQQLLKPEKVAQSLGSTQYEGVRCFDCTAAGMGFNLQLFSQVIDAQKFRCCKTCQAWTVERKVKTIRARTYRRGGLQEIHERCHCCGKESLRKKRTAKKRRNSSGSGGFSGGFGGGSSGGGGAGGSW